MQSNPIHHALPVVITGSVDGRDYDAVLQQYVGGKWAIKQARLLRGDGMSFRITLSQGSYDSQAEAELAVRSEISALQINY